MEIEHLKLQLSEQKDQIKSIETAITELKIEVARLVAIHESSRKFFYAAIVPGLVALVAVLGQWATK